MSVYINQNFDSVTLPALPSGWTDSGATWATSASESYSGSNSLKCSGASNAYAFAGDYGVTDSNNGNNSVEAKFYATSVTTASGSQVLGLFLRGTVNPSGSTMPGNAYVFYGSMLSGGSTFTIAYTNSGGTLTTLETITPSVTFAAGAWYRVILTVQDMLDTSVHLVSVYIQRMSDGVWLQESGSWGASGDVQVPFMSLPVSYTFGVTTQGIVYVTGWGTGTFSGVITKLVSTESMYVDDVVFQDVAAATGNVPASPSSAGNEVELVASATSASDGGQTGHTGSNLNTADTNFAAYYYSANTFAGGFNQYALLDAGSGVTVIPTAMLWSPGLGKDTVLGIGGGLELFMVGAVVEASNSTSGPWTQLGITPTNLFPRIQTLAFLRFTLGATAYRYFRLRSPLGPCAINQFRMLIQFTSGMTCRPARPSITPAAGRYGYGQTVTISSNTGTTNSQSTSIYYTVGTRTSPPADPTNASTLYSGPFIVPNHAPDETIVKAIAYNTGCSTATSAVTSAHFIIGTSRNSYALDGSTGYVSIPNATALQLSGACTLMAWVFSAATQSNYNPVIDKESGSGSNSAYYLGLNNQGTFGQVYFGFQAGANEADYTIPSNAWYGQWHHICGRFTGTATIIYVDGVQVASNTSSTGPANVATPLNLGSYQAGSAYFNGNISDVAIFSSDIGATAIAAIAAGTQLPSHYSPAGYWPCSDLGVNSPDLSGHSNNGTFVGNVQQSISVPSAIATQPAPVRSYGQFVPDTQVTGSTWFSNGSSFTWPSDLYDTSGVLVYSNNDHCQFDPVTGEYWLIGGSMAGGSMASAGGNVYYRGHNFYSSTDLINWTFQGQFIVNMPAPNAASTGQNLVDRFHLLINPNPLNSAKTYVLWGNVGNLNNGYAGCWTASAMTGPWTYQGAFQPNSAIVFDTNTFYDSVDDGTSHNRNKAYVVWSTTNGSNRDIVICQLDPATDWTSFTGSNTTIVSGGAHSWSSTPEGMVLCKYPFTGAGHYYILASKSTPYGAGDCAEQYASATTLAGLDSATAASFLPSYMGSSSSLYNSQTTCLFQITNLPAPAFILMLDQQDAGDTASPPNMYNSRMTWIPILASSAFGSGTLTVGIPINWDFSYLGQVVDNLMWLKQHTDFEFRDNWF